MNKKVLRLLLLAVCILVLLAIGLPWFFYPEDEVLRDLIAGTFPRLAVAMILMFLMDHRGFGGVLKVKWKGRDLLWSIPCFLVAVVNFPFTALIGGAAVIEHTRLIPLFLVKCVSIALLEEIFFRGLLLPLAFERFEKHPQGILLSVVTTSAIFSLMHILNLFFGAGFGATALQLGYTFFLGCMFAVMFFRTKNIWLCVLVHALFDVGGTIVTDLGSGLFQDLTFWILTATVGVLCTVYILFTLRKLMKKVD